MKVRAERTITTWLLLAILCHHAGADWSHWRGPSQNGVSLETGLVDDWTLDGKNILWEAEVGGRSTPIILNGRVYLNCRTQVDPTDPGDQINAREQVVCFDLQTGKILWRDVFNVAQTDIAAERVGWASMAGDPETGNVYMHSVSGLLRCYSGDGKRVWEYALAEHFGKISGFGGRTQTPIVDEDRIIVSFMATNWGATAGPAPAHYYYAFDKHSGELLWVSAPGGRPHDTNYSGAIVNVIGGRRMLIGGNSDGGIYAMEARTGKTIWGYRMSKRGLNATPAVAGARVYISHGEDNIDNLEFGRVQCIDATDTGDVTTSGGVWRRDGVKAGYAGLLVRDGILYVVTDSGSLVAMDQESGEPLWEHHLGTMGRGSPVWAEGKLYVTEVHGNVYILKPARDGCTTLSHVYIPGRDGDSYDEIFASPAISDSKVVIVSRDRTICLQDKSKTPGRNAAPAIPREVPAETEIATVQMVPYEVLLRPGESAKFQLRAFDRHGQSVRQVKATLNAPESDAFRIEGDTITVNRDASSFAGTLSASMEGYEVTSRVRVLSELPWQWNFDVGAGSDAVPPTWLRARGKLSSDPEGTMLVSRPGRGRPSSYIWLGDPAMRGYSVKADVMLSEQRRRLSNIGITAERYNLILKGNTGRLEIQSWAPQMRMAKEVPMRAEPDQWYTLKLSVELADGKAIVHGKAWRRGDTEPEKDTITAIDPHPNDSGSPGLYMYTLADCYFDNVEVSQQ